MLKLYPGYIWTSNDNTGSLTHCVQVTFAHSPEEAKEYALEAARQKFPIGLGYSNHGCDFTEVPQNIIDQLLSYSQGQSC